MYKDRTETVQDMVFMSEKVRNQKKKSTKHGRKTNRDCLLCGEMVERESRKTDKQEEEYILREEKN